MQKPLAGFLFQILRDKIQKDGYNSILQSNQKLTVVATRFSVVVQLYLKNRQQKVGGEESETIPMISSVPQGSVLGPLLFLI